MAAIDDAIQELYARPLDEFTPARNELAKQLRAGGDKAGSEQIKALRKPTVSAWALNQVARAHPRTITKLFDIGDRLGNATRAVMRGKGSATKVREIAAEERALITELVGAAVELLEANGHPPTATNRERIADTLAAVASDEAVREAIQQRRLATDARRVGFGDDTADLQLVPDTGGTTDEEPEPAREDAQRTRRLERLETKLAALQEEAGRLKAEAGDAETAAKEAAREAERATKNAERARNAADRAARRASETEAELRKA